MADEIDRACAREQLDTELAIQAHATRAAEQRLTPMGECYNCGAQIPDDHTFCDADCRDDYQHRRRYGGR